MPVAVAFQSFRLVRTDSVVTLVASLTPKAEWLHSVKDIEKALAALRRLPPMWKGEFLKACRAAIATDGLITDDEAEVLFAVADGIHAPA